MRFIARGETGCCGAEIWARRDGLRDGLLLYEQRSHVGRPACGIAGVAGGPNRHVVFDEGHFGIVNAPGIAALAHKYRLHGVIAALLILAGLFIWKNAVSLAPSPEADSLQGDVLGRDSAAGFASLLRRNVKSDRLLDVCIAEWSKTFAQGEKFSSREKLAVEAIAQEEQARPLRERNPL
jgi:hypothetical protein